MYEIVESIQPKWVGEFVLGNKNSMTQKEFLNLENLVVTISAVSCKEAFKIYNELMDCTFFIDDSLNPSRFELNEFLYVGPDSALFCIVFRLNVRDN